MSGINISQRIANFEEALGLCKRSLVAVFVFSLGCNLLMLTPIFYMINVYGKALAANSMPTLISLITIALFLYLILWLLEVVRTRVLIYVSSRLDALLAPRIYEICFASEAGSFNQKLGTRPLADLIGLRNFATGPGALILFDLPWIPLYMVIMLMFHPVLAVVGVICMAIMFLMALANQKASSKKLAAANAFASTIQQQTDRNLRNAEAAAAMGMKSALMGRWKTLQDQMLDSQVEASAASGVFSSALKVMNTLMQSIAITTGAVLAMQQEISPGVMIGAAMLLGRALQPIQMGVNGWKSFVDAREQYERVNALLVDMTEPESPMSLPAISGSVKVQQLTVIPPGAKEAVLNNVSFSINAGSLVLVMGPSAAGKSTLIRAILGLWEPIKGTVRLDGAEAHIYDRDEIGPQIGYLPQDIELLDGTIAENIARFGELDSEAVVSAAREAGIHQMILDLDKGYDTIVEGDRGKLSPGQRQRIGLARALYKNPKLVVLDEPNSNLDEEGERALMQALKSLKASGSTVFMVSHRQNAIPISDHMLILRNGAVERQGPTPKVVAEIQEIMAQRKQQAATKGIAKPIDSAAGT